jgi:ActR/RegA family two-component response regulator
MPGKGGLDVVQELRAVDSSMTIIVLTGYGSIPTAVAAMKRGADHYLSKPAEAGGLRDIAIAIGDDPLHVFPIPFWPASARFSGASGLALTTHRRLS